MENGLMLLAMVILNWTVNSASELTFNWVESEGVIQQLAMAFEVSASIQHCSNFTFGLTDWVIFQNFYVYLTIQDRVGEWRWKLFMDRYKLNLMAVSPQSEQYPKSVAYYERVRGPKGGRKWPKETGPMQCLLCVKTGLKAWKNRVRLQAYEFSDKTKSGGAPTMCTVLTWNMWPATELNHSLAKF